MFQNPRYVTCGVQAEIPPELQLFLWGLIDSMKVEKDYLQVFRLGKTEKDGNQLQKITHEQEVPEYSREYYARTSAPLTQKIFVIDDEDHSTMLLAEEY